MKLVEHFVSINGEGRYQGYPTLFLRFSTCNLRCSYCLGAPSKMELPWVTLAKDGNKRIDKVEKGNVLLTLGENGNKVETLVTNVIERDVDGYYKLDFENTVLYATEEHPFFTQRGWVEAKDLESGDEVLYLSNEEKMSYHNGMRLKNKSFVRGRMKVYNLSCSPHNSFIANGLLVHNCDTPYSYEGGEEKTVQEIVDIVIKSGLKRVTITGGEPLAQGYDMYLLCNQLLRYGYNVEVETNGSYDISDLPYNSRLCITMDWKCPSSGMMEHMLTENLDKLESKDVLKFVCGSEDDLLTAKHIINHYRPKCQVFFSPVFGQIEPKRIVEFMIENKLYNCRIQLQSHKIIWPPEQRGV